MTAHDFWERKFGKEPDDKDLLAIWMMREYHDYMMIGTEIEEHIEKLETLLKAAQDEIERLKQ